MDTTAAIRSKASDRLDAKRSISLRGILLICAIFFTLGLVAGSLATKARAKEIATIDNINAVFIDELSREGIEEQWNIVTGEVKIIREDNINFLLITGNLDGPFFLTTAQNQ